MSHIYHLGQPGERIALQDISGDIRQGELLAIIGPNGSGKSTLARHFNAVLLPTRGTVTVNGLSTADPANRWEIRCRVGMVLQNPDNQLVAAVVEEDVAFGPENLGLPPEEVRRRVDRALALAGLGEQRLRPPHLLSGGQKQRLAIAGALAMKPSCLVLDEPTAMLDPAGRREVIQTLLSLNREEGLTIVLVTHFMEEAVLADRVWVLSGGRLVLEGTPAQVFSHREALQKIGLALPGPAELAWRLRAAGWPVPAGILTLNDLVACLADLLSETGWGQQ
ncbi:energy-coupling factor transport system ATP-binding protein [Desulfofundulus thermosubterraneus DSM 16057]|uniref:Energy-coupling factor transport system ATP-binding protein n=1 Tax=Desulfofundulus thermosubterraneus DSM 16057 TaxID=1121432 RepID=A0A1M6GAL1_9FIRM|nr:energy-coupling factor transport system ATP-binding protein [Desulfofundulus thermosubterraneus DSM 16057]